MDELQAGVEQTLAVPPQPSVFVQPSESAFDDPAFGHDLEGVQLAAPGNLHRDALIEDFTHALRERLADVASIGQQTLYLRQVRLAALKRLQRRPQPLPLLLLVDVSGSMERYARLLLAFLHAATRQAHGVRVRRDVFTFGTRLTDLSAAFRQRDSDAMLALAGQAITDFAGGTQLGQALATLRQRHARRLVGRRTLVLLVSDGLDTGEPESLAQELAWLRRHTGRLLWLNPLLRWDGYAPTARGAAVLHRAADGMLAVHNLSELGALAAAIATLMKQ